MKLIYRCGGDKTWKNDKNETVVDLASKENPQLLQIMAKYSGDEMVKHDIKAYYHEHARTTIIDGYRSSKHSQ